MVATVMVVVDRTGQDIFGYGNFMYFLHIYALFCRFLMTYAFKESVKTFCNLNVQNKGVGVNNVFLNKVKKYWFPKTSQN